jgi:hypothetical protein
LTRARGLRFHGVVTSRVRGAWFQLASKIAVERCYGNENQRTINFGQLAKEIDVASDQFTLCNNDGWIPKLNQNLQTAARQLQAAFNRLIRIGDAADRDNLRLPSLRRQFLP